MFLPRVSPGWTVSPGLGDSPGNARRKKNNSREQAGEYKLDEGQGDSHGGRLGTQKGTYVVAREENASLT